jgi:hypothetical protein
MKARTKFISLTTFVCWSLFVSFVLIVPPESTLSKLTFFLLVFTSLLYSSLYLKFTYRQSTKISLMTVAALLLAMFGGLNVLSAILLVILFFLTP